MAYHEVRLAPGDPAEGPLGQVVVFVDDEGNSHYPGGEGYVEPEPASAEFLNDQGVQLAEDQTRIASGQDQQFSTEQRENTVAEAKRITDPNAAAASVPGAPEPPQRQPTQDPNAPPPPPA